MGGVMFGFDLGVITGVIPFIQRQFQLTGFALGWVVAVFELGAVAGTFIAGWLAEKSGQEKSPFVCRFLLPGQHCWDSHIR